MLSQLPVRALLALRQTCSLMRHLVDAGSGPRWLDIARHLQVAEQLLPQDAQHGPAVHAVLRDQAAVLSSIQKARPSMVHQGDLGSCSHVQLKWLLQKTGSGEASTLIHSQAAQIPLDLFIIMPQMGAASKAAAGYDISSGLCHVAARACEKPDRNENPIIWLPTYLSGLKA